MAASTEMVASSPQETWTNSWTCWTSGESFLEEKEQSLDWDFIPTLTTTSNTSLHLAQKSSGPFDDEFPGMTTDYGSLSNIKEMDKEMSFEDMNLSQVLDIDMPADANMSEDEFLNSFMDLSEFLQLPTEQPDEDTVEVKNVIKLEEDLDMHSALVDSVDEIVVCEEPTSPVRSVKREIDEVDMDDCDWSLNMDHDYVTKKPRLSQTPVVETTKETTKKPSKSTQSTSKSASHKLTPDQKYRERRVKNNIASRRSREIRKMKFGEMEEEANRLIVVNSELRTKIEEMEKLAKDMKALLVQKLAAK